MKRQFVYICTSPLRFVLFFSILGLKEIPVFVSSSSNHLNKTVSKALDNKEYLMIIFLIFSSKPYVVAPHLNCLDEMVQMRGHNMFSFKIT